MMSGTPTFEEQVNTVVSKMTVDESGKTVLPEDVEASAEVLYAAKLEKRHRDTQSAYTKNQQRLKQLERENEALASSWEQDAVKNLPAREKARLEELKVQDPDKWRTEIATLEEDQKNKFQEKRQAVSTKAQREIELQARQDALEEYNKTHSDNPLTDEVIENDIPPRLTKQLEKGEITFNDFIDQCDRLLNKPSKLKEGETVDPDPNLSAVSGSSKPSDTALSHKDASDYNKEIF